MFPKLFLAILKNSVTIFGLLCPKCGPHVQLSVLVCGFQTPQPFHIIFVYPFISTCLGIICVKFQNSRCDTQNYKHKHKPQVGHV
jgi:hypothetical protein